MPANELYDKGEVLQLNVGNSVTAGSPVLFGAALTGVALTSTPASGNQIASVATNGVFNLSCHGYSTVNAAITAGDILYYDAADTPKINVHTTGVRFGIALAGVTSGSTTTIPVKLGYGG